MNNAYVNRACHACGVTMYALSPKWRIPERTDITAWEDMSFAIASFESARADMRMKVCEAQALDAAQPLPSASALKKPASPIKAKNAHLDSTRRPAFVTRRTVLTRADQVRAKAPMPHYYYSLTHPCTAADADFVEMRGSKTPRYRAWSNPPPEPWILHVFPRRRGRVSARIRAT
ncbi:MAG TPA: hypothetical protein VK970_19740 [Candidatus Methylacidiphilales bacterium]|nr:hypothetical protein [Candidatus Methylacidiphilales bacterium]